MRFQGLKVKVNRDGDIDSFRFSSKHPMSDGPIPLFLAHAKNSIILSLFFPPKMRLIFTKITNA